MAGQRRDPAQVIDQGRVMAFAEINVSNLPNSVACLPRTTSRAGGIDMATAAMGDRDDELVDLTGRISATGHEVLR
jgi:hypothetical protein